MTVLTGAVRRVLPGGLELVAVERLGPPLAAVRLRLRAGSADEASGEHGLAHAVEHLVVRCSLQGGRVGDGALATAATGREHTTYRVLVRSGDLPAAVDVLGRAFTAPWADERILADELAVIRQEYAERAGDRRWRLQESLFSALWRPTAYAHPTLGDQPVPEGLTVEDVRRFHAARYRPAGALLVLAGEVAGQMDAVAEAASRWALEPSAPGRRGCGTGPPVRAVGAEIAEREGLAVGFAFGEPTGGDDGAHLSACRALARRAVRAVSGIDVRLLRLRGQRCTWLMLSAAHREAAAGAVGAALRSAVTRLRAPDGPAWLRAEALIPELRAVEDVESAAERALELGSAAGSWPALLAEVRAEDVTRTIGGWERRLGAVEFTRE
ncbi:M16 family metallopeptidase [Streptomyces hygroscopicus]|uniref:M16 family metallopeptidase n=1 Tax=Streptomyces hygroscopicus TaxID=1912 RepID=UPI00223F93ED|nr:insulinase family protein [Streptomyces hygroscopicus]